MRRCGGSPSERSTSSTKRDEKEAAEALELRNPEVKEHALGLHLEGGREVEDELMARLVAGRLSL